ncbi:MAG: HIT domain-containing protein [Phycisphaerales bacterium]
MMPPDPMRSASLHAPWRLDYLESISKSEKDATARGAGADPASVASSGAAKTTFLADYWANPQHDQANHLIVRTPLGMIVLNAFPYANGHLLVALGVAQATLLDYSPSQRGALWQLTDLAAALMQEALEPQGINIGVNQGRAAGAGVPSHLHVHLVPRWSGDVNFMSVVGQVRVIGASLEVMAARYALAWKRLRPRCRVLPDGGIEPPGYTQQ